jgi:hypothetical protein
LGDDDRAIRLHQCFKFKVVACWPEGERWWITAEQIAAVAKVIEQEAAPTVNEKDGAVRRPAGHLYQREGQMPRKCILGFAEAGAACNGRPRSAP